jgi:hypothetical protein
LYSKAGKKNFCRQKICFFYTNLFVSRNLVIGSPEAF